MHLQRYSLTEYEPEDRDYEFLEQEHGDFVRRHERARDAHARMKKHHLCILEETEKLLKLCESAM